MDGQFDPAGEGVGLGRCPHCSASIPASALLIRYRSEGGWPKQFADCPDCRSVVHPV